MQKPISRLIGRLDRGIVLLSWLKSSPLFQSQDETEFTSTRIWRQEVAFVFNDDYEEFFLNLEFSGADLLFEGQLPAAQKRRYEYRDATAVIGKTYAYWIQTRTSQPIGPIPVRVREMEVWWPYEKIQQEMQSLAELNPELVQVFTCGYTAQGREIPAVQIGSSPQRLALVGLIHAGEAGPELIVPVLRQFLQQDPHLFQKVSILAVPGVNLDAREKLANGTPWYLRTNHQ
ncbi:MAG: M14 family zinc carboxypeptidase, partial [Lentisphaeria bacterium]